MLWIAPSEKDTATDTLEKRLWAAADQFRANSGLSAAQYSQPGLDPACGSGGMFIPSARLVGKHNCHGSAFSPKATK